MTTNLKTKSEILFLYESVFSIPNGDPFTGEQRYDDETKKVLVSDVRIKRFIRDYLHEKGYEVYLFWDKEEIEKDKVIKKAKADENIKIESKKPAKKSGSGSANRMLQLKEKYRDIPTTIEIFKQCIDVRMFGGISTEEKDNLNITGPVQFALLNSSLNRVDLRVHQNTTVFPSNTDKNQGSIGTTAIVPYSVNQIHGWINPYSAEKSGLTDEDINLMLKALWESINNANTRTKSNQNSLLLLQIIYNDPSKKIYGLDNMIKLNSEKQDEEFRSIEDFEFNFQKLFDAISSNDINIKFYSKIPQIYNTFKNQNKFEEILL